MNRYPLLILWGGMLAAMTVAVLIVMLSMSLPEGDLRQFVMLMFATGSITVLLAYGFFLQGMTRYFTGLKWAILTSVVISILLVLLNIWFTARWMFISSYDLYISIALLTFAGLTALIFGLFVAQMITGRISDLVDAAECLAEGRLDTRLTVQGQDELADFARTFNWMAESLQQMDEQKRQIEQTRRDLIAGVSHDLRTPLTSIRVMLESIADEVVTRPEDMQRYIKNSLLEVRHLNLLIDDLFELAQLDAGRTDFQFEKASLRDLISDTLSSMKARAARKNLTLDSQIQTTPEIDPVRIAADKIQRVLNNLLDNALRYTPPDGTITIRAYRETDRVCVEVQNKGAVIEAEHLPHIFDSFYRIERSRTQSEDGQRSSGLGLAIARRFIEAHGGTISVQSDADSGTVFSFSLPG